MSALVEMISRGGFRIRADYVCIVCLMTSGESRRRR